MKIKIAKIKLKSQVKVKRIKLFFKIQIIIKNLKNKKIRKNVSVFLLTNMKKKILFAQVFIQTTFYKI